jgi:hypothetical protein
MTPINRKGITMNRNWISGFLVVLCGIACEQAIAMPIGGAYVPEGATRTGEGFFMRSGGTWAYDAVAEQMSYRVPGGEFWSPDGVVPSASRVSGLIAWTAPIDIYGNLKDYGVASVVLDIGNGLELLASGRVIDFAFDRGFCYPAPADFCTYTIPQVTVEVDFVDSRVRAWFGDLFLIRNFVQMSFGNVEDNRLVTFNCENGCNNRFSHDDIVAYYVPEPEQLGVTLATLLFGVLAVRRRGVWRNGR